MLLINLLFLIAALFTWLVGAALHLYRDPNQATLRLAPPLTRLFIPRLPGPQSALAVGLQSAAYILATGVVLSLFLNPTVQTTFLTVWYLMVVLLLLLWHMAIIPALRR